MYLIRDPREMSPEERLRELAAILAEGFARVRRRTGGADMASVSEAQDMADLSKMPFSAPRDIPQG